VVALNKFSSDSRQEIDLVAKKAGDFGADDFSVSQVWAKGSRGGLDLARSVARVSGAPKRFKFLYPLEAGLKEKIEAVAKRMYGAGGVRYSPAAQEKLNSYAKFGWAKLPVCMAKTALSLSHDPDLKGAPAGFSLPVRDVRAFIGAGFIAPLCGNIQTMPGLPAHPRGEGIDIDRQGNIVGLF
jgi:formyltetrahydrofolate synthetase